MTKGNFIATWNSIEESGGASFNFTTGELNPDSGYMVSVKGHEKIVAMPANLNRFQDVINEYLTVELLDLILDNENLYLGFWLHEGKLFVDLSEQFETLGEAINTAKANGQIAFFDCYNKVSITFPITKKVSDDPDLETDKHI